MKLARYMGMVAALSLVACGGSERKTLSYDEFRGRVYQEPDTGLFVINGDELAETEDHLREAYQRYYADDLADRTGLGVDHGALIVNLVNGKDDKWPSATASNLTYCISQSSFGSQYTNVVNAMASATGAWEATANVNYVHASQYDSSCSKTSPVVFNVRMVRTPQYLARAFFPSTSRSGREILVSSSSFGNISPWTLAGVFRHELGHTIGFRHEHTRPESGTCFEDNNWRALTAYDSASVMHYPQCNGTNKGDLSLTSLDKTGAKSLYP